MTYFLKYFLYLALVTMNNSFSKSIKSSELKNYAVVKVSVADLSTESLQVIFKNQPAEISYKDMPFAESQGFFSCARVHQLLFNEVVKILKYSGPEVKCELSNIFFENNSHIPIKSFWTLKKYIMPLDQAKKEGYNIDYVPERYSDEKQNLLLDNNILTLSWTWYDPITRKHYSAGTRFVRDSANDKASYYAIKLLDLTKKANRLSFVPKKFAVVQYSKNPDVTIKKFVKLLKRWANQGDNFIAYLTGGCSFIKTYSSDDFYLKEKKQNNRTVKFWMRPNSKSPYTGMDCSCLIARAAQVVGMPYYFKNTTTLAKYLKVLKPKEKLENGDLIWYNGHVLIVSDIKHNKLIESAGYPFGHGKVHEIALKDIFKGIKTYKDLLKKYFGNQSLERIKNSGEVGKKILRFKFFKIRSTWKD